MSGNKLTRKDTDLRVLPEYLLNALTAYFHLQEQSFISRGLPATKARILSGWAKEFVVHFMVSRLKRAIDLEKAESHEARALEELYIGENNQHFMVTCMDGRNIPAIMLSHVPHVGGVIRTQAGDIFTVGEGSGKSDFIVESSSFIAQRVRDLMLKNPGQTIHYSFDSHFGCAARKDLHLSTGKQDKDLGLRQDIKRKITLARWLQKTRNDLSISCPTVAEIKPQFFSYKPDEGTITMGMEIYTEDVDFGFTSETILELIKNKKIVSTWEFLADKSIVSKLSQLVKQVDFRNDFAQSLLSNWQVITKLYQSGNGAIYQKIYAGLEGIYKKAHWKIDSQDDFDKKQISRVVLSNKAKVMLKNLVTRWSIAQNNPKWPFDKHIEQAIVLTEGGYAPFSEIDVFSVFSKEDFYPMLGHIYKSVDLIRHFRREKAISDPLDLLEGDQFTQAPVVIFNKAIVRDMGESSWNEFKKIDFTSVWSQFRWDNDSINWKRGDLVNFMLKGIRHQGIDIRLSLIDAHSFYDGLYELFDRARIMVADSSRFNTQLRDGNLLIINLMTDKNRKARLLIPILI